MGGDYDGFYHQIVLDYARIRLDMGHSGLIDQERAFYSNAEDYFGGEDDRYLHSRSGGMAWGVGFYAL